MGEKFANSSIENCHFYTVIENYRFSGDRDPSVKTDRQPVNLLLGLHDYSLFLHNKSFMKHTGLKKLSIYLYPWFKSG